jgi:nitrous oxidase accessory protein NosD
MSGFLYVGGDGPGNYSTIQDAIDAATPGDTVMVYPGTYREHLVVSKTLTVRGVDAEKVTVDGNFTGTLCQIQARNVRVAGIWFQNSGGAADDACVSSDADDTTIDNCTFSTARTGVVVRQARAFSVTSCSWYRTSRGLQVTDAHDGRVARCSFGKCGIGLLLDGATRVALHKITGDLNGVTVLLANASSVALEDLYLANNNENQVNLLAEQSRAITVDNATLHHCGFGARFQDCTDVTLSNTTVRECKLAVQLVYSHGVTITSSSLYDNDVGVYLHSSGAATVRRSNLHANYVAGIAANASMCDARYNWWGTPRGPFGKVYASDGTVRCIPWLYDPVAVDDPRAPRPGDAVVRGRCDRSVPVADGAGNDTDGDGVPDWWEVKYGYDPFTPDAHMVLDPDGDGLSNCEEYLTDCWGSHPFRRDLFVEVDAMDARHALADDKKSLLTERFAAHNISLHIDDGSMGGGEVIGPQGYTDYAALTDIYWTYFLHENPVHWRKGVFHYVLLADSLFKDMPGFVFIGWDEADAFSLNLDYYEREIPPLFRDFVLATVFMHELGHTLGLFHDVFPGIDNESTIIPFLLPFIRGQLTYVNYRSCMNYQYAWQVMDYSDGTHGKNDFDDWGHVDLTFFQDSRWGS